MSEIPTDIIEAAKSYWPSAREDAAPIHMTIARAILAERQRCAEIVLNTTSGKGYVIPSRLEDNPLARAILA